jgi:hypothetical protein
MGHTVGDGLIVLALAAAGIAYMYFKHRERQRRLEAEDVAQDVMVRVCGRSVTWRSSQRRYSWAHL